jgi:hypothetical protein
MKKIFLLFVVMAIALFQHPAHAGNTGWNIDGICKFQIVYLPPEGQSLSRASVPGGQFMEPLLKNIPAYKPDIDNIVYKDILGMGFPLPAHKDASLHKLYLKLYAWPSQLDPVRSSHKIFDDFLLYGVEGGERLYESSRNPANVYVKYASIDRADKVFSDRQPFPTPGVPKQWEFDSHLPFSSIYVAPENISREGTEADQAKASALGVVAFHTALSKAYERYLYLLAVTDEKKYYVDFCRCPDSADRICAVRIYEVPAKPLVFDNYRDLPMPQDAHKVFLSGLLLVKLVEYVANSPMSIKEIEKMQPGTKVFNSGFRTVRSHMLEVASVFSVR